MPSEQRPLRFSDRIGATTPPTVLLVDSISLTLRNSLWNFLLQALFGGSYDAQKRVVEKIAQRFLRFPLDRLPTRYIAVDWVRDTFFYHQDTPWWQIYNFLEFIAADREFFWHAGHTTTINRILQEEMSAYRFINGVLAPISSEQEIAAVTEASERAQSAGLQGVHTHLRTAVELMSKKPEPDYRNSIKESISAVESLAKQITGETSGGLDKALGKLDEKLEFHAAFKAGLLSLYGYTSDGDGIRHAILEEPVVGFDEAKFMLISCSAFINFMVAKADAAGLLPKQ